MKKILNILMVLAVMAALSACKPSSIEAQTEVQTQENGLPYGVIETKPTMEYKEPSLEYVIPEGAKGPGDCYVEGDQYEYYPEDRKPTGTETPVVQVRYFYVNSEGMNDDFDLMESTECTAEDLIRIMITGGVLTEGTEVVSYQAEGDTAAITLNQLEGQYAEATAEQLAQAVANTLMDNFLLDSASVTVGDKTYGPLEFKD